MSLEPVRIHSTQEPSQPDEARAIALMKDAAAANAMMPFHLDLTPTDGGYFAVAKRMGVVTVSHSALQSGLEKALAALKVEGAQSLRPRANGVYIPSEVVLGFARTVLADGERMKARILANIAADTTISPEARLEQADKVQRGFSVTSTESFQTFGSTLRDNSGLASGWARGISRSWKS